MSDRIECLRSAAKVFSRLEAAPQRLEDRDLNDWGTLVGKDGVELESQCHPILEHLGKQHGLLGLVFRKAQNKIQDPAKRKRLISDLLDGDLELSSVEHGQDAFSMAAPQSSSKSRSV